MSVFNPDAGGVPSPNMPDQTGASQGTTPNKSFGILFEGLGDALSGATKAIDTGIKYSIEQDVRSGFEDAMKPYNETIPTELRNSGSAIKTLQSAYEQGKISDTYYTGQLTALNKSLRSKYPGYEGFVDEMVQSVTGIRPANSYRNAIMSEFEEQKRLAREQEQSNDTWIRQNEEVIAQVVPDYFNDPSKYNFDEVRAATVKKKAEIAAIQQENSRLSLLFNQDKLTEEQAVEGATTIFNDLVSSGLSASSNVTFGLNPKDFLKKIEDMSASGFEGEEYNQLVTGFAQAKAQALLALKARANQVDEYGNSLVKMAGAKNIDELINSAMEPYNQIEQLLINKDFGLAGYYTRLNTLNGDKELNRVLNASPELRTANALASIDRGLATLYITEGGKQEGIFSDIAPEITARVINGDDTFNDATTRIVESSATNSEKAAGINTILTSLIETVKSGNATPEQIVNAAESLYSLDDKGRDLFQYVKPDERMRLYAKLFNPEVTKAMIASGSKEALNTYYEAARDRIFAIPELTKAAAALGETNSNWKDYFEVKAMPNGRLELVVKQDGVQPFVPIGPIGMNWPDRFFQEGLIGGIRYAFDKKKAEEAINALNYAFDNLGNIAEGLGVDQGRKPAIYGEVLRQLNVDLEQGEKEGFFKWLGNSVRDFFVMDESEGNALNQSIQENVSLNLPEDPAYEMGTTGDVITDTIIGFEGFRATPYYDVNANRVGYGSDEITLADGTVQAVTPGMTVTKEDAARDLNRRLTTEFIPEIIDDIGKDRWSVLTPNQQAALASIAYNYGSLPSSVVKAVKKGDIVAFAKAISNMERHNDGINQKRRRKEGEMFIGDSQGQDFWKSPR